MRSAAWRWPCTNPWIHSAPSWIAQTSLARSIPRLRISALAWSAKVAAVVRRAKYVICVVTIWSSSLCLRRSTAPIATTLTSAHTPPTSGTMLPSLLIAIRSAAGSSGQALSGCACVFSPSSIRCPTASVCRRAVEACTTTPSVLSRCFAARPNGSSLLMLTRVCCACGNRCPSGTSNSLSRGKKPAPTLRAGHIGAFHFDLLPPVRLPPPSRSSAGLQRLSTLLTHQFLAGFTLGGGTGLGCLFDHPRSQTMHLLIDRVFNLGQRRVRMGLSPLCHGGKDVLSLCVPTR